MEQNVRSFVRMLLERSKITGDVKEEAMTWTKMMTSGEGINKDILQAVLERVIERMRGVQDDKSEEVVNDIMKFLLGDSMSLSPQLGVTGSEEPVKMVNSDVSNDMMSVSSDINKVKEDVVNYISEKLEKVDKSLVLDRSILNDYAKSSGLQLDGKMLNEIKSHIEKHFGNKGLTIIIKGSIIQFIKA